MFFLVLVATELKSVSPRVPLQDHIAGIPSTPFPRGAKKPPSYGVVPHVTRAWPPATGSKTVECCKTTLVLLKVIFYFWPFLGAFWELFFIFWGFLKQIQATLLLACLRFLLFEGLRLRFLKFLWFVWSCVFFWVSFIVLLFILPDIFSKARACRLRKKDLTKIHPKEKNSHEKSYEIG